jgi:hypothetical protein
MIESVSRRSKIDDSVKERVFMLLRQEKSNSEIVKLLGISSTSVTALSQGLTPTEYQYQQAAKRGFNSWFKYQRKLATDRGFSSTVDYTRSLTKKKMENLSPSQKLLAKKKSLNASAGYRRRFKKKRNMKTWTDYKKSLIKKRNFPSEKAYKIYLEGLVPDIIVPLLLESGKLKLTSIPKIIEDKFGFKFSVRSIFRKLIKEKEVIKNNQKFIITIDSFGLVSLDVNQISINITN